LMPYLDLGRSRIEYSVLHGTSKRYAYFRFRPDLTLEVVLPKGSVVDAQKVIRDRLAWVRREYERLSRTRTVLSRDSVMLEGTTMKVVFEVGPLESLVIDRERKEFRIRGTDRRAIRELVRRLFLKESSAYAVRKVAEVAGLLGVRPRRVDVREIGKWGYCTRGGRLSFSWQLIALPERLREYVVFHELAHLVNFDHSAAFRRTLASVCDDFRQREKDLDCVVPYDRLAPPE
jgi:predicted metal-dependent hydrolase